MHGSHAGKSAVRKSASTVNNVWRSGTGEKNPRHNLNASRSAGGGNGADSGNSVTFGVMMHLPRNDCTVGQVGSQFDLHCVATLKLRDLTAGLIGTAG